MQAPDPGRHGRRHRFEPEPGGAVPEQRREPGSGYVRAIWTAAGTVILLWPLREIATALLVFFLALVFAIALNAPVTWLERRGCTESSPACSYS